MALAIFDLDNTLLQGDSDHAWGQFLVDKDLVDVAEYQRANDYFYQQYLQGGLDIHEYLAFALKPLSEHSLEELQQWHQDFMQEVIEPMILPAAEALIEKHRQQGDTLLIITATNGFVTHPIAERLGIEHILASEPEFIDDRYTGKVAGIPCFQEGKVTRLEDWLDSRAIDMKGSYFYSDSHNDLPLLNRVDYPVAVDADDILHAHALQQGWPSISLRDQ